MHSSLIILQVPLYCAYLGSGSGTIEALYQQVRWFWWFKEVIQAICDGLAAAVVHKNVIGVRVKMDSMRRGSSGLHAELAPTVGSMGEASRSCHACPLSLSISIRLPCKLF